MSGDVELLYSVLFLMRIETGGLIVSDDVVDAMDDLCTRRGWEGLSICGVGEGIERRRGMCADGIHR
jgi:hypothetical protein